MMNKEKWILKEDIFNDDTKILLDSYKVLKNNFERNDEEIRSIFVQLEPYCPRKVVELWHEQIKKNYPLIIKGEDYVYTYGIMNGIIYGMVIEDGYDGIIPYLLEDDLILPTMYQYGDVEYFPEELLAKIILHEEYEEADRYLEMILKNRCYDKESQTFPLQAVIEYYGELFAKEENDIETWNPDEKERQKAAALEQKYQEAKNLFEKHMAKVTNKTHKAKLNVAYLQMKKTIEKNRPVFDE